MICAECNDVNEFKYASRRLQLIQDKDINPTLSKAPRRRGGLSSPSAGITQDTDFSSRHEHPVTQDDLPRFLSPSLLQEILTYGSSRLHTNHHHSWVSVRVCSTNYEYSSLSGEVLLYQNSSGRAHRGPLPIPHSYSILLKLPE